MNKTQVNQHLDGDLREAKDAKEDKQNDQRAGALSSWQKTTMCRKFSLGEGDGAWIFN